MPQPASLSSLRRTIAALEPSAFPGTDRRFALGSPALDTWLGGGLARGVLHEIHAGHVRQPVAAIGFGLGMAVRAAGGRRLAWVRHDMAVAETGRPCGEGLAAFGLDPDLFLVVRVRDPTSALRAASEVVRCPGIGAALVEIRGMPRVLDLTASRRLALAAGASGVTLVMIRLCANPAPGAAASRWRVEAAASVPLEANAPGRPAFAAALLRHRAGLGPRTWRLEWDSDGAIFVSATRSCAALSRPALSFPAGGSVAAEQAPASERARGETPLRRRAG